MYNINEENSKIPEKDTIKKPRRLSKVKEVCTSEYITIQETNLGSTYSTEVLYSYIMKFLK